MNDIIDLKKIKCATIKDENIRRLLSATDHTLLTQTATKQQIFAICEDALIYKTASVCIPPSYVAYAREISSGALNICTVIGFPNGYNTAYVKRAEIREAISNGASELDVVINLGCLKNGEYELVLSELRDLKKECGDKILKVIIETCLLTEEEKIRMCDIVSASGADFIKTSTGFSSGGATRDDVALFKKHCAPHVRIKAAGGISSISDGLDFLSLGASRVGTSRIIKLVKSEQNI